MTTKYRAITKNMDVVGRQGHCMVDNRKVTTEHPNQVLAESDMNVENKQAKHTYKGTNVHKEQGKDRALPSSARDSN